jgi:hypothetical protein
MSWVDSSLDNGNKKEEKDAVDMSERLSKRS